MKLPQVRKATVRIAVIDSDPLRFVGFRVLLSAEPDLELHSVALAEIGINQEVDIVLLGIGNHPLGANDLRYLTRVKCLISNHFLLIIL